MKSDYRCIDIAGRLLTVIAGSVVFAAMTGCVSMMPGEKHIDDETSIRRHMVPAVAEYAGEWAYTSSCNQGHYVTLDLRMDPVGIVGEWSDGTQLRGSQGKLHGVVAGSHLEVALCDEGGGGSGNSACPYFTEGQNSLELRGNSLVWRQRFGAAFTDYVTLQRAGAVDPAAGKSLMCAT